MTYRTILVHLNDERRMMRLLTPAIALAERWNCHLIGASALPPVYVVPTGAPGSGDAVVIDEHRNEYQRELDRIKSAFAEATAGRALVTEWREEDALHDSVAERIGALARCADLIIASQTNADWAGSYYHDVGDRLIVEGGRPVLLVPNAGHFETVGKRILLAWNGTREATRVTFDALPVLKHAEQVIVMRVDGADGRPGALSASTADICATLARHGVKCTALNAEHGSGGVGRTLLATSADRKCDLLVMGCYGHSRLREFVFGGATRTVLESMQIPVLMSH